MASEVEIKLDVDAANASRLAAVGAFSGEASHQRQVSVYFDTPKAKLRRNGWVLRVRQVDGRFIQTIKHSGASSIPVEREEWEEEVAGLAPDQKATAKTPLAAILKAAQFRQLAPICRCDVDRSIRKISNGKGSFELAHDVGSVKAKGACQPIHEVELELKQGELKDVLASARRIVRQAPVKIGVLTKSERGFALADGKQNVPVKAVPVVLAESMSVAEGFAVVAGACLKQFRLNEPLLIAEHDAEALHQLRVSVRRLRSALWLFKPAIRDSQLAGFRDQLRRLTRELGAARNIDVILATMPTNDPARSHLEANRRQLYAKIIRKLDSRGFRLLIFDLFAWVQAGKWRTGKKALEPLMPFAIRRLDRLWVRIERKAGHFGRLSNRERHKLRINTKKMRYAVEFLAEPLKPLTGKRLKFVRAAENIQDRLGELNDLATRQELLFAWNQTSANKARSRHLRAAKRHFGTLREIGPFWDRYED